MSTTRRVGRGALIYGLQPVLARTASILMLPLYTRYLTPADYGVLQLLGTTIEIVSILFTAGAIVGVNRLYFKRTQVAERNQLLSTAWLLHLALAVCGGLLVLLFAPLFNDHLLKGSGTVLLVQIAGLNLATSVISAVPQQRLQITEQASWYTAINLLRLVMQLSLNLLFVAGLELGVMGPLLGTLITNVVLGAVLAAMMLKETGIHWDGAAKEDLLRFGRPGRLTAVGSFILNSGDRYFVAAFWPTAVVGTYGLAYQFGYGFVQFFVSPLSSAWDPIRYDMGNRVRSEWEPGYLRIFELGNVLYITGFVCIVAFISPVVRLLTTQEFFGAVALVPPIVAAYLAQAWTATFAYQLNMAERPDIYTKTTWWSIAAVIVFYFALIPSFGGAGAAWATFGGFAVRAVLTYNTAQKVWPIAYSWTRVRWMCAMAIAVAIGAMASQSLPILPQIGIGLSLSSAFIATVTVTVIDDADRRRLKALVSQRIGR